MKPYIVNLTDHLINKNKFDELAKRIFEWEVFVKHVEINLSSGDVAQMSPATLGKIMCSFEIGDVMAGKIQLMSRVYFAGDCGELLRCLVSACLAHAIWQRLNPYHGSTVPAWQGKRKLS